MGGFPYHSVCNHPSIINAKRATFLYLIIEIFKFEEVHLKGNKDFFELLTSDYESKRVKRNPSNQQAFLRISSGLLELGSCVETTSTKLSLIVEEIHAMGAIIDYTTSSFTNLFVDHVNRVTNLLQEVTSKNRQGIETIMNLLKEFQVISES